MVTMTSELAGKLQGDILRLQHRYKKEFHISQAEANLRAATEIAQREGFPDAQTLRSALGEFRFGATEQPTKRKYRKQPKLPLAVVPDGTKLIADQLIERLGNQDGRLPLDWQTAVTLGEGITPYMVGKARRELMNRGWVVRYRNDGYDCIQVKPPVDKAPLVDVPKPAPTPEPTPLVTDAEQIGPMIHELLALSKAQLQMQAGTYRKLGELVELFAKVWQ